MRRGHILEVNSDPRLLDPPRILVRHQGRNATIAISVPATLRDLGVLEQLTARGKVPLLGFVVEVQEAILHCAKALKRSRLWEAETWPAEDALVSRADVPRPRPGSGRDG